MSSTLKGAGAIFHSNLVKFGEKLPVIHLDEDDIDYLFEVQVLSQYHRTTLNSNIICLCS